MWEEVSEEPGIYYLRKDSCLGKVSRELSSLFGWYRTLVAGSKALVLRFGCHYNYVWLVIVDPASRICEKDGKVKRITDNIGVCFHIFDVIGH